MREERSDADNPNGNYLGHKWVDLKYLHEEGRDQDAGDCSAHPDGEKSWEIVSDATPGLEDKSAVHGESYCDGDHLRGKNCQKIVPAGHEAKAEQQQIEDRDRSRYDDIMRRLREIIYSLDFALRHSYS